MSIVRRQVIQRSSIQAGFEQALLNAVQDLGITPVRSGWQQHPLRFSQRQAARVVAAWVEWALKVGIDPKRTWDLVHVAGDRHLVTWEGLGDTSTGDHFAEWELVVTETDEDIPPFPEPK